MLVEGEPRMAMTSEVTDDFQLGRDSMFRF